MKYPDSILPAGKKWKLVWNDEFDGVELDTTKWDFRRHLLQQKHDTFCGAEGLEFPGDSCVHLKRIRKANGEFYSCQLQTGYNYMDMPADRFCWQGDGPDAPKFSWPPANLKQNKFLHKFGYYEIRCKLQKELGWWSAFWMQCPFISCSLDPETAGVEVDIMECFDARHVSSNNHWNGYGPDHRHAGSVKYIPEPTDDDFHLFGLEWDPGYYRYYVDGKLFWSCKAPVSQVEEFLLVSTECNGYRNSFHAAPELANTDHPDDEFVVDFVRVYDEMKA